MSARRPRLRCLSCLLFAALALAGCARGPGEGAFDMSVAGPEAAPVAADARNWGAGTVVAAEPAHFVVAETREPYLLDTGDRLRIFVYGQPNLSRLYTVDEGGGISVPLIGRVIARGQTTTALERVLRGRLGSEYVKDPQVTVDIQQNRPFFILGEVRAPGQYPYVPGMTVETTVAIAGGYSERASERSVRITRRAGGLVEQLETPSDFPLKPSDTVYVRERLF